MERQSLFYYSPIQIALWIIGAVMMINVVSACQHEGVETTEPLYIPPTRIVQTQPSPIATIPKQNKPTEVPKPTATMICTNILSFIDDVTIPDGTRVYPGEQLDKRWLLENTGTCNWNENYRLRLIGGSSLGANSEMKLYPARSGARFEARILFTAPEEAGIYRSAWQAYDPDGNPFGDPFYIEIVVEENPDN